MTKNTANKRAIEILLFESDKTTEEISENTGIPFTTIFNLRKGHRKYMKLNLEYAIRLTNEQKS